MAEAPGAIARLNTLLDGMGKPDFMFSWDRALGYANAFYGVLALFVSAYYYLSKVTCSLPITLAPRAEYIETWCSQKHVQAHFVAWGLCIQAVLLMIPYGAFYLLCSARLHLLSTAVASEMKELEGQEDADESAEFDILDDQHARRSVDIVTAAHRKHVHLYTARWDYALSLIGFDGLDHRDKISRCASQRQCIHARQVFSLAYLVASLSYIAMLIAGVAYWGVLVHDVKLPLIVSSTLDLEQLVNVIALNKTTSLASMSSVSGQFECASVPMYANASQQAAGVFVVPLSDLLQCNFPAVRVLRGVSILVLATLCILLLCALLKLVRDSTFFLEGDEEMIREALNQKFPDLFLSKHRDVVARLDELRWQRRRDRLKPISEEARQKLQDLYTHTQRRRAQQARSRAPRRVQSSASQPSVQSPPAR